jgi:hypothetical protein
MADCGLRKDSDEPRLLGDDDTNPYRPARNLPKLTGQTPGAGYVLVLAANADQAYNQPSPAKISSPGD